MAKVSTYLNFRTETEKAFEFYKSVFGGDFNSHSLTRFSDMPPQEGGPLLSEADKNLIMHIELTLPGGHVLMGCDAPESMGFQIVQGNNSYISLELDTRVETDRVFAALAEGGQITMPLQDMFWGAYFGSCTDKFGIQWMFNFPN